MRIVAIIPAKGTSRRLPKKNIYPLWGEPMLYWAIKACKKSQYDIEPWVSTEDKEVAKIAKSLEVEIPGLRPKKLALSKSDQFDTHSYIFKQLNFNDQNSVVCVLNNNPFINMMNDIDYDEDYQMQQAIQLSIEER